MLELLNALDNSSIGNDAKFTRFMVFKTKQSGIIISRDDMNHSIKLVDHHQVINNK